MTASIAPNLITIVFGGLNKERMVSVASAQALHTALPEAGLWFWDADDRVYETSGAALLGHGGLGEVFERAKSLDRVGLLELSPGEGF